jgi:hypothetical protein
MTPLGKPKRKRYIPIPETPDTVPEQWPITPDVPTELPTQVPENV